MHMPQVTYRFRCKNPTRKVTFLKVIAFDIDTATARAEAFAENIGFDIGDVEFCEALPIGYTEFKIHTNEASVTNVSLNNPSVHA